MALDPILIQPLLFDCEAICLMRKQYHIYLQNVVDNERKIDNSIVLLEHTVNTMHTSKRLNWKIRSFDSTKRSRFKFQHKVLNWQCGFAMQWLQQQQKNKTRAGKKHGIAKAQYPLAARESWLTTEWKRKPAKLQTWPCINRNFEKVWYINETCASSNLIKLPFFWCDCN